MIYKKNLILTLLFIILLTAQSCAFGGSLKKIKEIKADPHVLSASFLNENYGILGHGESTERHTYTVDGGKTWTVSEYAPSLSRHYTEIINESASISSGVRGILATENGGKTWNKISDVSWYLLSFNDKNNGWAADGFGKLMITGNAGSSWMEIELTAEIRKVSAICCLNENKGYLTDEKGNLFFTKDTGKTWDKIKIDFKKYNLNFIKEFTKIKFKNENEGIIITRAVSPKEEWAILKTADGGKSWTIKTFKEDAGMIYISNDFKYITVLSVSTKPEIILYKNSDLF